MIKNIIMPIIKGFVRTVVKDTESVKRKMKKDEERHLLYVWKEMYWIHMQGLLQEQERHSGLKALRPEDA